MDMNRVKHVLDNASKTTMENLESWDRVEKYSTVIHINPNLHTPINRPEIKGFKFQQKFNRKRAEKIEKEILNLLDNG